MFIDIDHVIELHNTYKMSLRQIAPIVGCCVSHLSKKLKKQGFKARTPTEYNMIRGSISYHLLNDRAWLYDQYINHKKTCSYIAPKAGVKNSNEETVVCALKRHGIPLRDRHESRILNRNDCGFGIDHDIIEGTLLGDACLEVYKKGNKECHTRYCKKNKYYEHSLWVAEQLFSREPESRIFKDSTKLNGKIFEAYKIRTLYHESLDFYYRRWYPESTGFKKHIPNDVCISPKAMLHWFLDDGTSWANKKTGEIKLYFCTQGFIYEEQVLLANRISEKYGIKARVNSTGKSKKGKGTGFHIRICKNDIPLFFNIIGLPPVTCQSHKWKYQVETQ